MDIERLSKEVDQLRLDLRALEREVRGPASAKAEAPKTEVKADRPSPAPAPQKPPQSKQEEPPKPRQPLPPIMPIPPRRAFDWESLVGVKLFSWIAGIALVLAAVFFLKYSVEHGWLSPMIRATMGLVSGTALLIVCELRIARRYATTASAMLGAGIAILYSTLYAIHGLWHLLPAGVVFALMIVVTATAVMLSIRRDAVFVALLGLMGGFATPALLSNGENRPIVLFSYLLLLNAGLAWVGLRKNWPVLAIGSLIFSTLYQWAWVAVFLTSSQFPLAVTIFGVFAIAGASSLWIRGALGKRSDKPQFKYVAVAGSILPVVFAIFSAAIPAYGTQFNVLFPFLLLITSALALIGVSRGPKWLPALSSLAAVLTFAIWATQSYTANAFPAVLGWIAAFVVVQLAFALRKNTSTASGAATLFFMFPILAYVEPMTAAPLYLFATLFALLALTAAYSIYRRANHVYPVAAFFAIATQAVWTTMHLTAATLIDALLVHGSFALLLFAVPVIARKLGRSLEARGISTVLLMATAGLFFLAQIPIAGAALYPLVFLLVILLTSAFIEANSTNRPWLAAIATGLGWLVLAAWWGATALATALIPALSVVMILAIFELGVTAWIGRTGNGRGFAPVVYVALSAYAFLTYIASQNSLAFPPWPLFAILTIVTLASGIAARYLSREGLAIGATVGSQIVLMTWSMNATIQPWLNIALAGAVAAAALGLLWYSLDSRKPQLLIAAILGLFAAHVVAIATGIAAARPLFGPLLLTHVAIAAAVLVLAWISERYEILLAEVPLAAMATALARLQTPAHEFVFSAALYALFVAFPLALSTRARERLEPYLAAVLASVPFFFFARHAMIAAGLNGVIGILPLGQAMIMMLLVLQLLRIEPRGNRDTTRLAIVCAAALAFITVAIPLQLDKEWITLSWALEAAALIWLFQRIPHRGLLAWGGALLSIVFVRLMLNPAVLAYHPASHLPVFNWYLYTYGIAALAFFVAGHFWPRELRPGVVVGNTGGAILLFALLNIEIADFYSRGPTLTFNFLSSSLAQDLTYTIGWALFAIALLIAGIVFQTRSARGAALGLLAITILKCFLHDLARLGGLYRVGSLFGLAVSLVLVGILLQRFVMASKTATSEAA